MVLGKRPVPGRPTIWIIVGQGSIALVVGAGGGCLDIFILIYPFSPSLWETARYRLKYCLKGPLNPKQPTNHLSLPRKSVVRLTDRPNMTLNVYRGRKTTIQQQQKKKENTTKSILEAYSCICVPIASNGILLVTNIGDISEYMS